MRVILGVTGCIAAYKSPAVLRELQQKGAEVRVVMTNHAREFIGAATLEGLSGHPVVDQMFQPELNADIRHISLARWGELLLVAPATANALAKFACGIADDFLSTLFLSIRCPALLVPAMNLEMWRHPATRENVRILRERGVDVIEPDLGYLACGAEGEGRMPESSEITVRALTLLASAQGSRGEDLAGVRMVVTAGPTIEDIDPVRYLGNRSSGKMGFSLARAARRRGAEVTLISGSSALEPPDGVRFAPVRSTQEMYRTVMNYFEDAHVVIMAAAVADYRPAEVSAQKVKKGSGSLSLELVPTVDILSELGRDKGERILVGFAAETESPVENGRKKLRQKNLDLIVVNDVSRRDIGFGHDMNEVMLIDRGDSVRTFERDTKDRIADRILDRVSAMLADRRLIPEIPGY